MVRKTWEGIGRGLGKRGFGKLGMADGRENRENEMLKVDEGSERI